VLAALLHGLGRYGSHGGRMWQEKGKGADEPAEVLSSCTSVPKFGLSKVVGPLPGLMEVQSGFGTIFII